MKVAVFPPSLGIGGVERVSLNLAQGFASSGLDTDLLVIKARGDFLTHVPDNVRLVNLSGKRALTSLPALMRYLHRERPDVLVAASEPINLIAIWAKLLTRVPTRIAALILNTPSARQANTLYKREKLYPLLTRWSYPHADYLIAIAESIRQDLSSFSGIDLDRIHTINTPVITPEFFERADETIDHSWLGNGGPPIVLGVARFVPQKDLVTLIRAFHEVHLSRPARLIIVGDGPERAKLETLITSLQIDSYVSLPGFANNLPFMKHAQVFVLSSIFEGLPTVLIEALALCPAIVSADCPGGIREILRDGEYGQIVPIQDSSAMAQAIIKALDKPPDSKPLRQRSADFSLENIIEQYRNVLELD
jgi:glycosyltransferase involved in cell wall biosynthesis